LTPTSVAQQYKENGLLRFSGNTLKKFYIVATDIYSPTINKNALFRSQRNNY